MRRLPFFVQNLLILFLAAVLPVCAANYVGTTHMSQLSVTNNVTVGGTLTVTGATTQTGAVTFTAKPTLSTATIGASGDTYTIPDVGNASFVMTAGTQTIAGAKTFSTPPTITGGLTAANIASGSAKRQVAVVRLSPETGACADSTVYRGSAYFGRAGTVTRITYGTGVDPVSGTNVIAIEKGSYSGNTMLSTATVSLNGTTANTGVTAALTSTSADLGLTAAQPVCCEYNAGSQGTDAEQVTVTIEFEPTDF